MVKKNDDFFIRKKDWSLIKDDLLKCYLKPYISKIILTRKPLLYIDCFAGKGKFEDGKLGSPLIALEIINQCKEMSSIKDSKIEATFIELNYAEDLKENLVRYPWVNIVSGIYEEKIQSILECKDCYNIFLYIDPYGIKSLKFSIFDSLVNKKYNSIEFLLNLNSFGFIREACHVLGTKFEDNIIFNDLVEYEPTILNASHNSIIELNRIAGGDYWQQIIESYKKGLIDGYTAEDQFSKKYCSRLMNNYKYVLNMPIRIKKGQRPKYRLVHVTNHKDGCLLMVDNICNRWEALQKIQTKGQLTIWEENYDNNIFDEEDIKNKAIEFFSQFNKNYISLYESLARFFVNYGPICSTSIIKSILKKLENYGKLSIVRNPKLTGNGKLSTYMIEDKKHSVSIRWIK